MKLILSLTALVISSAVQADFRCVTKEEAVTLATTNIESLRYEIHSQSNIWVTREKIRQYVSTMDFSASEEQYATGVLAKWTCAPGADCYVGIKVDCSGEVGTFLYAD